MATGRARKRMLRRKNEEKKVYSSNWPGLHEDLLDLILDKLDYLLDIVRFGLVCKPWNSRASVHEQKFKPLLNHQPPLLLVNTFPQNGKKRNQSLYNTTDGSEILNKRFKLCIPYEYQHKYWYGSSYGWLLYKEEGKNVIILFNPLSGCIIRLPSISYEIEFAKSIILSNDPYLGTFEVLVYCHGIVAHLRFGNESWTYSEQISIDFCSFAFYKGCMLGVTKSGGIWSLDLIHSFNGSSSMIKFKEEIDGSSSSIRLEIAGHLNEDFYSLPIRSAFVETTNGDLLLVSKYYPLRQRFKVFKITGSNIGQFDIVSVKKLDGHSLFFESSVPYRPYQQCISVSASNLAGCKANSIYSSNRCFKVEGKGCILKRPIEVYNLEDQSLETNEQIFPISNVGRSRIHSAFSLVPSIKHTSRTN